MKKKPLILITNDDGITAPGLRSLIKVMNKIGEVVVVAPDSPQSAMGHAITINNTLFCKKERTALSLISYHYIMYHLEIIKNLLEQQNILHLN